jgi:hypothetical protein
MRDLKPATTLEREMPRGRLLANGTGFTGKASKGVEAARTDEQPRDIPKGGGARAATIRGEQSPKWAF